MPKKRKNKLAAIDFETFYSSDVSIAKMSTYQYVHHPEFDAYMVSIYCDHMEYVGRPTDFDWRRLDGYTLVAHNASFDQRVFERLQELGTIPLGLNVNWVCTADMCVYLQYPRSLKGSAKAVLDADMSKEVRTMMKDKTWEDLEALDVLKDALAYALDDSKYCYQLWVKLNHLWPEDEKQLSCLTRAMSYEGVPGDTQALDKGADFLERQKFEAQNRLPWYDTVDPDTKKVYAVYSKKALALECRKIGIPTPASLDKNSKEFAEWDEQYGDQITFAADMQNVQRINKHLKTLRAMQGRLTKADRISFNLKYFGADVTGRWSGGGGLNMQNLPREPQYGVDIRGCIAAPRGSTLIVADLSQIEARLTSWMSGDMGTVKLLREGMSPYEAHARRTMGWTGGILKEEDPDLYTLAKVRVLQLGYGSGWVKFADTVKNYGQQQILDRSFSRKDEVRFQEFASAYQPGKASQYPHTDLFDRRQWVNSYIQVDDFRKKNPGITEAWRDYGAGLKACADGDDYAFTIPSGRTLRYLRCRHEVIDGEKKISAATQQGGLRRSFFYGANLFQNSVQACARDIFAFHLTQLDDAGYKVVLHVHDEVVIEAKVSRAKADLQDILRIMSTTPAWAKQVPVSADGYLTQEYKK
jgi:hypothetical protein